MSEQEIVATDERTREFLDVEAQARKLAERLNRLDEVSARYSAAAGNLDNAAQATRELTDVLQSVGAAVTESIDVVGSVGGPEIVKRLSTVEANGDVLLKKINLAFYAAAAAAALAFGALVVSLLR